MSSKQNKSESNVILSYYDCLLRKEDVDLLRGPCWLNDTLIGFYYEYLQRKHDEIWNGKREILFISPSMTQLLKLSQIEDYNIFLEPLDAKDYNYILFPLNNCEIREFVGGSHWTLLVFSKKERTCFELDSFIGAKQQTALSFVRKIMEYFLNVNEESLERVDCPQQENGYDCGLFVLCYADVILQQIQKVDGIRKCRFDSTRSLARTKRETLLNLIYEIREKQKTEDSSN